MLITFLNETQSQREAPRTKKTPPKRGEYGTNNLADQIAEFVHRIFLIAQQAI